MTTLTNGQLLSSFWVVDKKHIYIGSAGMDWRALSTVLEFINVKYYITLRQLSLEAAVKLAKSIFFHHLDITFLLAEVAYCTFEICAFQGACSLYFLHLFRLCFNALGCGCLCMQALTPEHTAQLAQQWRALSVVA